MLCVVFVVVRRTPYDVYDERDTTSMTTAVRCVRRSWYIGENKRITKRIQFKSKTFKKEIGRENERTAVGFQ